MGPDLGPEPQASSPEPTLGHHMFLYYIGRALQLAGMWVLLLAIVTAGPLGPSPRIFGYGVAVFLVGWFIVRRRRVTKP